jgi:protein-S-isoprenylcysteine O-methyltransferase Ste14
VQVLRENTFLSRVVEVQENQRVIDTGLYGVVRHPMYLSATLIFLSVPLVLGSPPGCLVMLLVLPLMVIRIRGEERLLRAELEGYEDYCSRVRWRLIPLIW